MSELYDLLAGTQMGNQAGDTAAQGLLSSGSQPKGSPQFWIPIIGPLQTQIAGLNRIADDINRIGGMEADERVYDIIKCTEKLQGMIIDIQKQVEEMSQGSNAMQQQQVA